MINLLPPQRLASLRIARSNTILRRYIELILASLLIFIAAAFAGYYFLYIQQNDTQKTVDLSQEKIAKLQPVQKQAEQLSGTVNTIAGLFSRNVKFSDMLTQIGGVMPPGSVLTGLQFSIEDLKSPLIITANVDTQAKAAILRNNLASSPLFSRAEVQSISAIGAEGTTNSTPTNGTDSNSVQNNGEYQFTAVVNAYFKPNVLGKKQ
jgi:Tfp pilus assembly protein PilN